MVTAPVDAPVTLEDIAEDVFEYLWGDERGSIPTAGDHAFERIWSQVISGSRQPGERLSDVEIAGQLGVSRTPVRQALHRLAQSELVRFDPRRGFWVREFTVKDVHEIYDIRAALEALAVSQAGPHLRFSDLEAQLAQLRRVRERVVETPIVPFLQHDFECHNLLIRASGNGRLIRMLAALRSQVSFFQIRDASYPDRIEMSLEGHEKVLNALLAHRSDEAASLVAAHIAMAKANVVADMFEVQDVGSWRADHGILG
jgi:DNA-binding GntR family transcriptional regulator